MIRASWDEVWMTLAESMALRSNCERRQIGCVIATAENRIVATGYNGPPAGYPKECRSGCPRARLAIDGDVGAGYENCISVHAEANALMFCDRRDREGGSIYVVEAPCWDCSKLIANSGLRRIVIATLQDQRHRKPWEGMELMQASGLAVEVLVAVAP